MYMTPFEESISLVLYLSFSEINKIEVPFLSRSAPFMNDIVVSNEGVTKLLKRLNPSKALGPDELYPRVLKELAAELGPVFAISFKSLLTRVKSIKNGLLQIYVPSIKRLFACNYHPVSLTCVPCKLLEHIVCSNIMAHLDEYKLLSDRQHAFRKKAQL